MHGEVFLFAAFYLKGVNPTLVSSAAKYGAAARGWAGLDFAETTKGDPEAIIGSASADCHTENSLISYRPTEKRNCERPPGARFTTGDQIATKTEFYFAAGDTSVGFTLFDQLVAGYPIIP